jgi:hypothetical protein
MTVLSFESLLLAISSAFILLAMAKERAEFRHLTAAMVDPLTGSQIAARFCRMPRCSPSATATIRDQPLFWRSILTDSN